MKNYCLFLTLVVFFINGCNDSSQQLTSHSTSLLINNLQTYKHQVKENLYKSFIPPKNSENEKGKVAFTIDNEGKTKITYIQADSENLRQSILETFKKATPFPSPPSIEPVNLTITFVVR